MPTDDLYHMNQLGKGASHGYALGDELNKVQADLEEVISYGKTKCLNPATWAEGAGANTIKTTAAMAYMIDGVVYGKAATDNIANPTVAAIGTAKFSAIVLQVNGTGTVTAQKGADATSAALALAAIDDITLTATLCPCAVVVVEAPAAATYTFASQDLTGTASSFVFYDFVGMGPEEFDGGAYTQTFVALT